MSSPSTRALVALACAGATLGVAGPASAAAPTSSATLTAQQRSLKVDVRIQKFVVTKAGLRALGSASANLNGSAARKKVTFAVSKSATCSVLSLELQDLQLKLLGLNLNTSAINLRITGDTQRSLGALFCKLAKSLKISNATRAVSAAKSLNRRLAGRPLHAIRFASALTPQTAAAPAGGGGAKATTSQSTAPTCQVLDLILGPLRLDLLGLVVDLYGEDRSKPVQVTVTADPRGGVLGSTFCRLANGQAAS